MLSKITVSPAPHISQKLSTRRVMLDVVLGLVPALIAAGIFFRLQAMLVVVTCVATCLFSEWACNYIRKKPNSLGDLSAVVTGMIFAFSLPPHVPMYVAVIGSAFAIVVGKMLFGGLGSNIFNPAMAARAFVTASFGLAMTSWTVPATIPEAGLEKIEATQTTAVTQATPLAWSKMAVKGQVKTGDIQDQSKRAFVGAVGGCLGETSSIALILGGIYLLIRKTITYHIPLAVLLSAAVFATIAWLVNPDMYVRPDYHLFGGGLLICAFFIATDPVSVPLTTKGMWIYGAGVGSLVMLIRLVGGYPEGVMFAVLIMNAVTPLIDRSTKIVPVGGKPNHG